MTFGKRNGVKANGLAIHLDEVVKGGIPFLLSSSELQTSKDFHSVNM